MADRGDPKYIDLYADETTEQQAARLHALAKDPATIYFANDDHERPDLPHPVPADAWVWSHGNRWCAVVAGFHADDWWEGADDEDWQDAPHRWYRPISEVPTTGTLDYTTRAGRAVTATWTVSAQQYQALCEVIDDAKMDDTSEDTDSYAAGALAALGLRYDLIAPS